MCAYALERLREPVDTFELHVALGERPGREVDVRVGEAREDAAARRGRRRRGSAARSRACPRRRRRASPAIASARAVGSDGSIVRTTPFSRIMRGDCIDGEETEMVEHVAVNVTDWGARRRFYAAAARAARVPRRLRGGRGARVLRGRRAVSTSGSGGATPSAARTSRSSARDRATRRRVPRGGVSPPADATTARPGSARSTTRTTTRRSSSTRTATTSRRSATRRVAVRPRLRPCPGSR